MEIYLSLGSNLGDRRLNIMQALGMLDEALGVPYSRLSEIEESESWGFDGPAFLDCAVCYELPESWNGGTMVPVTTCISLLAVCKDIERRLGRHETMEFGPDGKRRYHDRTIDIDILFFGTETVDTPEITVPHRLIGERDFIKRPLRAIASAEIAEHFKDILE